MTHLKNEGCILYMSFCETVLNSYSVKLKYINIAYHLGVSDLM